MVGEVRRDRSETGPRKEEKGAMCALMTPVNPMAAEAKDTVLEVLRRDRKKFFELVEDPANWNVQTRCTEWEVRDLVGHMIDVTEGYLSRWEMEKTGGEGGTAGVP